MEANLNDDLNTLVLKQEVPRDVCKKIIDVVKDWEKGTVETPEREIKKEENNIRKSKIFWSYDQWIFDYIWKYMDVYNEITGLRYDISGVESIQITKYEKGDFYDFHFDGRGSHKNVVNEKVRKISMSIQLNEDYEGGEFKTAWCYRGELVTETLAKAEGTIILFPSILEHCVTPVTSGTRYSLVAWFIGSPFK
jgi:PKHD-type hydroxylase